MHSMHGAIIVANDPPCWTILAVNDVYLRLTHKTRDRLVGRPLFEAKPFGAALQYVGDAVQARIPKWRKWEGTVG